MSVMILKGVIEKLERPVWKLRIFEWFKFTAFRKKKSSNILAFGEEKIQHATF